MKQSRGLEKSDKTLIAIGILSILFCSFFYWNDSWMNRDLFSSSPVIGEIAHQENDTRHRSGDSLTWYKSSESEKIHVGDAIFSGSRSTAVLKMQHGNDLTVGENSMVVFRENKNQKFADLQNGNFKINFNGSLKLAINGQMTILEGKNSEIQISLEKDKPPQFKVLKGHATVQGQNGKQVALEENRTPAAAPPVQAPAKVPDPVPMKEQYTYFWRLYDLYKAEGTSLTEKEAAPVQVPLTVTTAWSGNASLVELSHDADFTQASKFQITTNLYDLASVFLGQNFWRVTNDGNHWSQTSSFWVDGKFLPEGKPQVSFAGGDHQPVLYPGSSTTLHISAPFETIGYVLQSSNDPEFTSKQTTWTPYPSVTVKFEKPGKYYYRTRAANASQELTQWSETFTVNVLEPMRLVHKKPEPKTKPAVEKSKLAQAKKEVPVQVAKQPEPPPQRQPTSVNSQISTKVDEPKSAFVNERYNSSEVSLLGFVWAMQSTSQVKYKENGPIATGTGVRALKWWDRSGVEGVAKTQVFGLNKQGGQNSLHDFEARYHYRISTGFPFGLARRLQTSFFGGAELYSNTSDYFSSKYTLINIGTLFEFPVWQHWSAGGEYVLGQGLDQSHKFEITGHFKYFWRPEWSMGAGYRLHLFQAGSVGSAPFGRLPYREGYTEAYSTLDYHF